MLAYSLIVGQLVSILMAGYMVYVNHSLYSVLLSSTRVHLWVQVLINLLLIYFTFHLIRILNISSKMRQAAREQREAKSKRVEMMVFGLMLSLVFYSLFYTVPFRYYYPTYLEYTVYYVNSFIQLLLLINLISTHSKTNDNIMKRKQRYAAFGAGFGLVLFYIYLQLLT